ncbi:MAG: hypothetical protein ABIL89_06285 [candidate division WOR-3 bacterium]|jgi:hypothetical protein
MLILINFISPFLPSPFSLSSNILSTFSRPEAVLYSPQLLGKNLSFEFSYSSDFSNIINRYYFGFQFYNFGFGWYSIKADEFFENLFAVGTSYRNLGIGLNIEPQNVLNSNGNIETKFYLRGVAGFYTYFEPFWFSGSILYEGKEGRNAGIFSMRYKAKNYDIFIDAMLEENYPLSFMISSLLKVHPMVNILLGYNTANMTFNAGLIIFKSNFKLGYRFKTHPFLGNSNGIGVGF